jgi:4'-phosphopantetheinyl transferase EntD
VATRRPEDGPRRPPRAREPLLDRLLPRGIAAAEASGEELEGDLPALWPSEESGVGPRAVHARRVAYHWSRELARRAMTALGHVPAAVPKGTSREPIWPADLVGSITHCEGYCAAAVAWRSEWCSVGIDAELAQLVVPGVVARIATPAEQQRLDGAADPERAAVALFSAKESVYKVWFPITGTWLGFHDAVVDFSDPEDVGGLQVARFVADLRVPPPVVHGRRLATLEGRMACHEGLVVTAIAVPAGGT